MNKQLKELLIECVEERLDYNVSGDFFHTESYIIYDRLSEIDKNYLKEYALKTNPEEDEVNLAWWELDSIIGLLLDILREEIE